MPVFRHTFLFEPGTWTASGQFWERGEIERAGQGLSIVRHTSVMWEIEGTMEILGAPPARFQNTYRLTVPHAGARIVPWQSNNPAIGTLTGASSSPTTRSSRPSKRATESSLAAST